MRQFFKIFAVAAAFFAGACATDATDDLAVELGGRTTKVTLSLEESRTQLGEKAAEAYPL